MKSTQVENHEQFVISLQLSIIQPGYHMVQVSTNTETQIIYDTLNYLQKFKKIAYACPVDLPHAKSLENIYNYLIASDDPVIELEEYDIVLLEKELSWLGLERACTERKQAAVCQLM